MWAPRLRAACRLGRRPYEGCAARPVGGDSLRPAEGVELVVRCLDVVRVGGLAAAADELLQVLAGLVLLVVPMSFVEPVGVGHPGVVEGVIELWIVVDRLLELAGGL